MLRYYNIDFSRNLLSHLIQDTGNNISQLMATRSDTYLQAHSNYNSIKFEQ